MAIRFRLRALMDREGIGQSELARETGLSFATIHRIYQDETNQVSFDTLAAILTALRERGIDAGLADVLEVDLPKGRRGR